MHGDTVESYWQYHRLCRGTREDRLLASQHMWAVDAVAEAVQKGEPSVISLLIALVEGAPNDDEVRVVGAGELEDLLVTHRKRLARPEGRELLGALDTAARTNGRFRRAMRSVFLQQEEISDEVRRLFRFLDPPRT